MTQSYSLDEASTITGIPAASLRRMLNKKELAGFKQPVRPGAIKEEWRIQQQAVDAMAKNSKRPDSDYQKLHDEWIGDLRSGYHTGEPITEKALYANSYGIKKFWEFLEITPSCHGINRENLRLALSKVPIDYEKRNDHYWMRMRMFYAVQSFAKLLIRKGLSNRMDWLDCDDFTPIQKFPTKRSNLVIGADRPEVTLKKLIEFNRAYTIGRAAYDVRMTEILLLVFFRTGVRRSEGANLKLEDIFLNDGYLKVLGKNFKEREIPIDGYLDPVLKKWINEWRAKVDSPWLFCHEDGKRVTEYTINKRFRFLAKRTGIHIHPHALRRAYGFHRIVVDDIDLPYVSASLGHSDYKVTKLYAEVTSSDAVRKMRGIGRKPKS